MRSTRSGLLVGTLLLQTVSTASCRSAQSTAVQQPAAPTSTARPPESARLEPQPVNPPTLAPPSARAMFRASVDSMVADAQWKNAHWGILIVDPERGDTLYAHNADKLFMPASNQKIVTGAVGLAQLGPDFQWRTIVELRGTTSGSKSCRSWPRSMARPSPSRTSMARSWRPI